MKNDAHAGERKALAVMAWLGVLAVALGALRTLSGTENTEGTEAENSAVTTTVQAAPQRVSFYSDDFPSELAHALDSNLYTQVILLENTREPDTVGLDLYLRNSAWEDPGAIAAQVGVVAEQLSKAGAENATFLSNRDAGPRIFIHNDHNDFASTLETATLAQLLELARAHHAKSFGLSRHISVSFENPEYRDRFIRDFRQQFPGGVGSEIFASTDAETVGPL